MTPSERNESDEQARLRRKLDLTSASLVAAQSALEDVAVQINRMRLDIASLSAQGQKREPEDGR